MNSQDFRNLQEAYLNVYDEDYKSWDFGPKQKAQAKYTELAQKKQKEILLQELRLEQMQLLQLLET